MATVPHSPFSPEQRRIFQDFLDTQGPLRVSQLFDTTLTLDIDYPDTAVIEFHGVFHVPADVGHNLWQELAQVSPPNPLNMSWDADGHTTYVNPSGHDPDQLRDPRRYTP